MDFPRLLAPITPEAFFAEVYEQRHLVVRRDAPRYYGELLSLADLDAVLTGMMVPVEEVQLVKTGIPIAPEEYSMPSGLVDPVRLAQQFTAGATMVLPHLHRRVPRLAAYCRSLEAVFSCDLQTNIYVTPAAAQGFKTHYDQHDVLVLQVEGSKTWRIYESPVVLPLRTQAFDPANFTAGKVIDTFVLGPGDMAYIPRGIVHDAVATEEMSLHITTGLLTQHWIDLLVEALVEHAHADPTLRAALPPGYARGAAAPAQVQAAFGAMLARAQAAIDPVATLDGFADEFRRRRVPVVPGHLLAEVAKAPVVAGAVFRRREDLIWALAGGEDDEEVTLAVYGATITFPGHVAPALAEVLAGAPLVLGELAGDLDAAGQEVLVRRLPREGVVQRVG